jgi:probable phosphoglycerate mutase
MKILVTRHGQTDWNVEKRIQGQTDVELNPTGIEQAHQTKKKLEKETIDVILCSPLKRAKQTADIININRNIPIIYDERLLEIDYGEIDGKLGSEFDYNGFWTITNTHQYKGAETLTNFIKRVHECLDELKKQEKENILIVTHNGVCRAINLYFNEIPEDGNIIHLGMDNCEVVEYWLE